MNGNTVLINVATSSGSDRWGSTWADQSRGRAGTPGFPGWQRRVCVRTMGQGSRGLEAAGGPIPGTADDWAMQAAGGLGDLYVEKNDLARAEAAYADFHRSYPAAAGNALRISVGEARIAFARNNAAQARQQIAPILQAALKNPATVAPLDGAMYGQAFYLSGELRENEGNYQGALEDYLRTVTLFYQDSSATARAQKSADALRAAHKDVTVP